MSRENSPKKEPLWTVRDVLSWTNTRFTQAGIENARLDAQLLLCFVLRLTKVQLYIEIDRPLADKERSDLRELVKKRLAGEPVAYLLKEKQWHHFNLFVDNRVLIPRPETESLLDFVLENAAHFSNKPSVILDLCTGSGCLAMGLAQKYPEATVVAVDIQSEALCVAAENAQRYNISNIRFMENDVTQPSFYNDFLKEYGQVSLLTANPPYVSEEDWQRLDIGVRNFEPKSALVAKDNGLFIGTQILKNSEISKILAEESLFMMELAEEQPKLLFPYFIKTMDFRIQYKDIPINEWFSLRDLEGKARFLAKMNCPKST